MHGGILVRIPAEDRKGDCSEVLIDLGKLLILLGVLVALIGVALIFSDRLPWLGRLPGDVVIRREHFVFVFPLTTCLLVSGLLSLLVYFFFRR
jgi:hypothetical protein